MRSVYEFLESIGLVDLQLYEHPRFNCIYGLTADRLVPGALREVVIGRGNNLFDGADSGGERAVAIYSLIGTAKLNGVDPEAWWRHVRPHIADHPVNRVDEFLPWHCTGQLPAILNTPLPSGVMPSSFNQPSGSRRW
jgi:hypothetical protein